jgi:16S rRNA (guanine1516-N2)-methyltransferase
LPTVKIAITATTQSELPQARQLAQRTQLALVDINCGEYDYLLVVTPTHVELRQTHSNSKALSIDFLSAQQRYRQQHSSRKNELLLRAIGFKHSQPLRILDATPGLGQDAYILASAGCQVTLCERSPIVAALLEDALARLSIANPSIAQRLHCFFADSIAHIQAQRDLPYEVIYLDPMFPSRKKSALNKISMRMLHDVVGEDNDANALLTASLQAACRRVVVKRPLHAPALTERKADIVYSGKAIRFDVYL